MFGCILQAIRLIYTSCLLALHAFRNINLVIFCRDQKNSLNIFGGVGKVVILMTFIRIVRAR